MVNISNQTLVGLMNPTIVKEIIVYDVTSMQLHNLTSNNASFHRLRIPSLTQACYVI